MRLTTSKIITLIIGCIIAVCLGTVAPQCVSAKLEKGGFIVSAPAALGGVAMVGTGKSAPHR